jgi:hypothetical protein
MGDVLSTIRLDGRQLSALRFEAGQVGAALDEGYLGEFRPAGEERCVALMCDHAGQLMRFAAGIALSMPPGLLSQLAVRVQEDKCGCGLHRAYYWPGVVVPEPVQVKVGRHKAGRP